MKNVRIALIIAFVIICVGSLMLVFWKKKKAIESLSENKEEHETVFDQKEEEKEEKVNN